MCLSPFLLSVPSPPDYGHTLYLARRRRSRSPLFLAGFFLYVDPDHSTRYSAVLHLAANESERQRSQNKRQPLRKDKEAKRKRREAKRKQGRRGRGERGGPRRVSLYYRINQQSGSDGASSEVPLGGERPREAEEGRCAATVDTTYLGAIARR